MTNEITLENINHIALSNVNLVLTDFENRIAALESANNQACSAAADERDGSAVPANGFDLAAHKAKLEQRLRECEAQYPTYTIDIMQARVAGQIDAYKHAIKLLDA